MFRIADLLVPVFLGLPLAAQMGDRAPVASNPIVEISGVIGQVLVAPGQGVPSLEVKHDGQTTKVYLGPLHYLIAENFSPKTGQEVVVKGYKQPDGVIAIQVTLTKEQKTLKLRDGNGWPLWRGGPWRGGRGRMMAGWPVPAK